MSHPGVTYWGGKEYGRTHPRTLFHPLEKIHKPVTNGIFSVIIGAEFWILHAVLVANGGPNYGRIVAVPRDS